MRNFKNFLNLLRKPTNSRFLFCRKGGKVNGSTRKDDAMKVICIIDEYFDRELNKYIKKDVVLEMNETRARFLIEKGFVKQVKQTKESKDVKQ